MKCVLIILRESTTNEIFDCRNVILCRNIDYEVRSDVFLWGSRFCNLLQENYGEYRYIFLPLLKLVFKNFLS